MGDEELIIDTGGIRLCIHKLAPGQKGPWRSHAAAADSFFCLSGKLLIRMKESERLLTAGGRYTVPPGMVYRLENPGLRTTRFLVMQGIGSCDMLPSPEIGRTS